MMDARADSVAGQNESDSRYMRRALELAARGLYTTDPNPRVGCVLVRDGRVLGEGWHERAGEAHAEVNALRAAGDAAQGATAYVTLEPCAHTGRTPPCTQALIGARGAWQYAAGCSLPKRIPNPTYPAGAGVARDPRLTGRSWLAPGRGCVQCGPAC